MKAFIHLVDTGATSRKFKNILGLDENGIKSNIKYIKYYRLYIELANKIKSIQKKRSLAPQNKKSQFTRQIQQLRSEYAPRLKEARK